MIQILIADDHQIFLDGLISLLETETDIEVTLTARNGQEVLTLLKTQTPDLILMDINMPVMDGLEATRKVVAEHPEVKVIMLTMHDRADYITQMIQAGASGYLLKNSSRKDLLEGIRTIASGGTYFSQEVTQAVMDSYRSQAKQATRRTEVALTPRETEVLKLIAQECTTGEVAERLFISPHTVESHRKNLLAKLGKKNTAGLAAEAVRLGLV
ncbi:UNVERIFIED_CONTAM: hypothetical protein GTU68_061084 [Idotea baltica]|nr:hypothetical protein [Idotea baltica]